MDNEQDMASAVALKAAKKELRCLMKKRLLEITNSAISSQSKLTNFHWELLADTFRHGSVQVYC